MMNRNNFYLSLSGLVILMAILACVIPGQTTQPAPVANSDSIGTFVAGTAQVSIEQTVQASFFTATSTLVPTETLISAPKISLAGTSLVIREDQSALFTDHTAGIQLIIPAGWLSVRINEDEYYKAFALDVVLANPAISDRLTKTRSNNSDYFRLDAIDIRPGHVVNGMISDINVIFQPDDFRSLEEWAEAERKRVSPFTGYKFLASKIQQTADGTRILVIEESWDYTSGGKVYYRGVFFSLPSGTIVLDFQTYLDFKDTVLPDFEQVVNSLTLLNP